MRPHELKKLKAKLRGKKNVIICRVNDESVRKVVSADVAIRLIGYGEFKLNPKPVPPRPKKVEKKAPAEKKTEAKPAPAEPDGDVWDRDGQPIDAVRDYTEMEFNDLRNLASVRGIGGTGDQQELIAKHMAYDLGDE